MNPDLSKYSVHFRDLDSEAARAIAHDMTKRIEELRLRLDLEYILPQIKGPDVLDFPIGTGRFYPNLIGHFNVYGYDIAVEYINLAKRDHPEIADHFFVCSLEEARVDRQFDTIVTLRTLNNIADCGRAVANVAAIVKPGGRWIFNYPVHGAHFDRLPAMLAANNLRIVKYTRYDFHTSIRRLRRIPRGIYRRYESAIEAGLVPYRVFRLVESIGAYRGTGLYVCEKSA